MKYRYIRRDGLEGWCFLEGPGRSLSVRDPFPVSAKSFSEAHRMPDETIRTRVFHHEEIRYPKEDVVEYVFVEDGDRSLATPHECVFRHRAASLKETARGRAESHAAVLALVEDALTPGASIIELLKALTAARAALGGGKS